ncbi:MAG: hypothetical protein V4659_04150 [Pseudomonadota bacterium]
MAITGVDAALAGMRFPRPFLKTGNTMPTAGGFRAYTPWYVGGVPGVGATPAAGVNGAALTAPVAGQISRENPASGNAHVARFTMAVSQPGVIMLVDRLWANSGLSATLTTAQTLTPAALPARDIAASINGDGVIAAIEWSATGGAGTPTVTLSYTNQAGVAGRTATLVGLTAPVTGTVEFFALQAGDTGIQSIQSYTASATRTSGTFHLVLYRIINILEINLSNTGNALDVLTGSMPRVLNDSVLQVLFVNTSTSQANFTGTYVETHG